MNSTIRRVGLAILGVAAAAVVVGCAAGTGQTDTSGSSTTSIGKGLGSQSAVGDVKIAPWKRDSALGIVTAKVTVTNHSHKRSDYIVDLTLESADGLTQFSTAPVLVSGLNPGQATVQDADFFSATSLVPADAVVRVQTIERTKAL
jgi:hypothetical protein